MRPLAPQQLVLCDRQAHWRALGGCCVSEARSFRTGDDAPVHRQIQLVLSAGRGHAQEQPAGCCAQQLDCRQAPAAGAATTGGHQTRRNTPSACTRCRARCAVAPVAAGDRTASQGLAEDAPEQCTEL